MSKLLDDIVVCTAVVLGLLIALLLSWLLVEQGAPYPPTLISVFLGIAVAALTYRFLGGTAGTEFSVGLLKLGGSAALLLGTTWFVGDRLRDEIKLYASMDTYREEITNLQKGQNGRDATIKELRRKLAALPKERDALTLAEIRQLEPDDPLIRDIRRLVEGQEGPFRQTIRELVVRVSVAAIGRRGPQFTICGDTLEALNAGIDVPETQVLLSRTLADGSPVSIKAERAGRISADVCAKADTQAEDSPVREFDIQINCEVAETLFPDTIANCAEAGQLRGRKVTLGALAG